MLCENTSSDITLDKHGCVHGDTSFHHDIVPESSAHGQVAVWCKYSNSETDDRIASYQHRLLKVKGLCDGGSVHCHTHMPSHTRPSNFHVKGQRAWGRG